MPEHELPADVYKRIKLLCAQGDRLAAAGNGPEAWKKYEAALNLVPQPVEDWEAAMWILATMGDLLYHQRDFPRAAALLEHALRCAGGMGNVFVHLRLGESYFELGDEPRAGDNLARAYMGGGREVFRREDPRYFAFLERILKPPAGQDRL